MSFAGGSGSAGDPYLVSNATQFQQILCVASERKHFRLTRDIDLSGRRFMPFGDGNLAFRGGIDGAGYTIRNLNIDLPEHPYVGLIGAGYESFIRNVRFVDPTVRGSTYVGILYGEGYADYNVVIENVTIEGGFVRARETFGGLAGRIQDASFINVDADVELQISANYHGGATYSSGSAQDFSLSAIGGLAGEMDESTISGVNLDVRITMDPRMTWIETLRRTGGLIGYTDEEIGIDRVTAKVFMDLTVEYTGSNSSTIGGLMGDYLDTVIFTDSSAILDITLRSPANANEKTLQDIGGITGYVEEISVTGLDLGGTITLDTRASLSTVTVRDVGGAFGQTEGFPAMMNDSHIDVDVIILGRNATVQHVGSLIGEAERFSAANVRVDGRVHVEADGTNIGGLVGDRDGVTPYRTFTGVIYRGEGVSAGSGSTNVGAIWGFQGLVQGSSVFWDRHRNGISTFDANELGRPARSSELGDMTWLIDNGFDPDAWCVIMEGEQSIPAVKRVTPACGGGTGGGIDDGTGGGNTITIPTTPTNLTATPGDGIVTLTWEAPTTGGNPTYQIDVSTDTGNTWNPAATTPCNPASPTCAVITDLTNGTPYTFRVTATTTAGTSPAAGTILATPQAPTDVPDITRVIPGANRVWLIVATPTPTTAGHELSLDAGVTWQPITPHVGDRIFRITNLTNGTSYRLKLRSVRADGSTSEPTPTTTLMPTGIRVPAPTLMVAVDPASITTNDGGDGTLTLTIDLLITNTGSTPLTDVWLQWPALPAGAAITGFATLTDQGTWYALDDWWYGDDVDLAAGATHRVRVSMETQP